MIDGAIQAYAKHHFDQPAHEALAAGAVAPGLRREGAVHLFEGSGAVVGEHPRLSE